MNRQIIKSPVWHGDSCLGDADVSPAKNNPQFQFPSNEIRIARFSPPSERCPPLSILHTISPFTILCKVQSLTATDQSPIYRLYLSCFHEQKTAIVVSGQIELHLVAMPTKVDRPPCFWCFSVPVGLYNSCMGMLNLRCLAIVFDLDETLIVANTLKSFEDRIEALSRRIDMENDPLRVSGMYAELRRYLEDKALLKQYADSDNVMDNGRLLGVQNEEVHAPSSSSEPIVRPVIRLQDKNIVLTRINPEIRDTSVLVRLRPAWEDLRSYLTAKGRKRFEVYVCTMAERDYALEMWRLLDPGSHLINSKQLSDRIVCVKSGSRKSLLNVFQSANCHPRMAMVIDDRMKVWDEKDQARVHVVPAFTPYHAPQAETANAVPVLCVARNVACNVRGGFFKEFDENVLRRVYELYFENDISNLPFTPDVSSFLITEDSVHSREASVHEGINGVEAERKDNGFENLDERKMQPQLLSTNSSLWDDEVSRIRGAHANKDTILSAISIAVLNEIGRRCESKVEFKPVQNSSKDSQTSVEVYFNGEKIGTGSGQTVKEAQHHAADTALRHLANSYVAYVTVNRGTVDGDLSGLSLSLQNENGFLSEHNDAADNSNGEELPKACSSASGGSTMPVADDNATRKKLPRSVVEIKEERVMCVREDLHLVFREQTQASVMVLNGEHCSQATKETLGASKAAESRSGQKQSGTSRA